MEEAAGSQGFDDSFFYQLAVVVRPGIFVTESTLHALAQFAGCFVHAADADIASFCTDPGNGSGDQKYCAGITWRPWSCSVHCRNAGAGQNNSKDAK